MIPVMEMFRRHEEDPRFPVGMGTTVQASEPMRTVNVFYAGAMFYIEFKLNGSLVGGVRRIKILPGEILDWLVAEKIP